MKRCPYCAEEIQDEAIKCRYCFSDLRVSPDEAMGQRPESTSGASAPAEPGSQDPAASPIGGPMMGGSIRYSHSGYRYVLGYGADFFGLWDRQTPSAPMERYPRTDEGWRQAWLRFVALEPNHVPVPQDTSGPPQAASTAVSPSQSPPAAPQAAPEAADTEVVQYTHSGTRYLLGYGKTFFGIWDRQNPASPVERFARDDDGWAAAWRRFTQIESNFAEVSIGGGQPSS